jgi:hypothetical protein
MPEPPEPFPIPPRVPAWPVDLDATALEDFTAMLQEAEDLRIELAGAHQRREQAGDQIWLSIAEAIADAESRLRAGIDPADPAAARDQAAGALDVLEALRAEQGIEIVWATGRRVEELEPGEFELLATEPSSRPDNQGLVTLTPRPAVYRHGRLLRAGKIVIATAPPMVEENQP